MGGSVSNTEHRTPNTERGLNQDTLTWWLQQTGLPRSRFDSLRPDFLVISPPKTGSTWLADNLRCHPEVFVPAAKEVKYFSTYFRSLELSWYLDQFAPGTGRIKGEASPSYAILPVERIKLIHQLMPDVKLIFLMREPVSRAWSHAKHNFRYREANFAASNSEFAEVSASVWQDNFVHDWPLASGDYLGQLRRYLSVFPREQVYIGFYESIAREPETLLHDLFGFLGIHRDIDLEKFPVRDRILPGLADKLPPHLRESLLGVLQNRSRELAAYLHDLGLTPPAQWDETLAAPSGAGDYTPESAFAHEFDDRYLAKVLAIEESFPAASFPIRDGYRGFNLVYHRGLHYAIDHSLGRIWPDQIDAAELQKLQDERRCFIAPRSLDVKDAVDQLIYDRNEYRLNELPCFRSANHTFHIRLNGMDKAIHDALIAINAIEQDMDRLQPWIRFIQRVLRPAWRGLWSLFGMKRPVLQQ